MVDQRNTSRRKALRILGTAATATSLTGIVSAERPGNSESAFGKQLVEVREATQKYQDIMKAFEDGYEVMGPYVPNMGWHLVKLDQVDESPTRTNPTGLTYNLRGELGSVEYVVPETESPPDLFDDEGKAGHTTDEWHPHHSAQHVYATPEVEDPNDTTDNPEKFSDPSFLNPGHWMELSDHLSLFPPKRPDLEVGDEITIPWPPDFKEETRTVDGLIEHGDWSTLHAWVHINNPKGIFTPFNPGPRFDPL